MISPSNIGLAGVSTAIDFGLNAYSANRANQQSWDNVKSAHALSMDAYKKRYQHTMEDMRRAGLNPILAASGGFNVGSGPTASAPTAHMANSPETFMTNAKSVQNIDQSKATVRSILKDVEKTGGEIGKIAKETRNLNQVYIKLKKEAKILAEKVKQEKVKSKIYNLINVSEKGYKQLFELLNDPILQRDLKTGATSLITEGGQVIKDAKGFLEKQIADFNSIIESVTGTYNKISSGIKNFRKNSNDDVERKLKNFRNKWR